MAAKQKGSRPDEILPRLKEVYGFMTANDLETVEVEEPGLKLRLVRRKVAPAAVPVPLFVGGAAPAQSGTADVNAGRGNRAAGEDSLPAGCSAVKASMMGIFYRSPSPSAPPFVKEGDAVKAGQVLCIIEAMKVFNELKSEQTGTVIKVLAENGKPVKAGQDVFWLRRT